MARSERAPSPQPKFEFIDNKKADLSFGTVSDFMDKFQKFQGETDPYVDQATVKFKSDNPITVYAIGDVHFGSDASKMDLFMRDMEVIRETPNAHMVILSNLIDAFIPSHHTGGKLNSPLPVYKEAKAMNGLLKQLAAEDKVLGMVHSPCHEGWAETHAGIDVQQIMFEHTGIPMLENGGVLKMEFPNGRVFSAGLWHQSGGGGEGNNESWKHQAKSRIGTTDAIMIGHSHVAVVSQAPFGEHPNRKDVSLVRSGSYKGNVTNEKGAITDRFQRGHSGRDGEPGGQSVTFFPRTGDMKVHYNPLRAAEYQQALNKFAVLEATGRPEDVWESIKSVAARANLPPKSK